MLLDVRRVWVIQQKSTGSFLTVDLFLSRSLADAGRCFDVESAKETGQINFQQDYQLHTFYEVNHD